MPEAGATRPAVAVVLPFYGDQGEAHEAVAELSRLRLESSDELIVADNTEDAIVARGPSSSEIRVVECETKRSAYAARNIGAEQSRAPWVLYIDADCRPAPDLLERYFDPPPGPRTAAVAGRIVGDAAQPGIVPRYVRSRRHLDQERSLRSHPYRPMAVTANLLVRRSALEEVGGFQEQTLSGADAELCWRLQDAGWQLEYRSGAVVSHRHRATLRTLLAQAARDGAGHRWLSRRWEGLDPHIPASKLARALIGFVGWTVLTRVQRGAFKGIDGIWSVAWNLGTLRDSRPPLDPPPTAEEVILLKSFPADGAGVAQLAARARGGARLRIEGVRRPQRADWRTGRALPAALMEDDGPLRRLISMLRVAHRAPRARGGSIPLPALAPAARRLAEDPAGTRVYTEADLLTDGRRLASLAGRPRTAVRPLEELTPRLRQPPRGSGPPSPRPSAPS